MDHKKSKSVSNVLKLMDEDYSYEEAIKIVLASSDNDLSKEQLEKELVIYI